MRKKLIYLALLGIAICQGAYQAQGADAALKYLQGSGTLPSLAPRDCSAACNENACVADLNGKNYRCFKGCSQHTGIAQIMSCANRQFISFVNDLQAQLNVLNQQFNVQGQQLKDLVAQLADAVANFSRQKLKLSGKKAENAALQQRFDALEINFNSEQQRLALLVAKNQQLHDRLADANANINQKLIDIAGLNAEIVANQNEITSLKIEMDDIWTQFTALREAVVGLLGEVNELDIILGTKIDAIKNLTGSLKEQIIQAKDIIRKYNLELKPHIKLKKEELELMMKDIEEIKQNEADFIKIANEFLNELKRNIDEAWQESAGAL